jgi:putative FmdB family regulatory protein
MPYYEYRCTSCGRKFVTTDRADSTRCSYCTGTATRRFSFSITPGFKEHWNQAVGQYVSNTTQFTDSLKRQSDEMSVRTGMLHDYEPIDPGDLRSDPEAFGVTPEGLDSSRRQWHDSTDGYMTPDTNL